jgi:hypothetical protein
MISLHVTLYTTEEGDQFKVMKVNDEGTLVDMTSAYDVTSVQTEDGRNGWTVVPKSDERTERHLTGAEL